MVSVCCLEIESANLLYSSTEDRIDEQEWSNSSANSSTIQNQEDFFIIRVYSAICLLRKKAVYHEHLRMFCAVLLKSGFLLNSVCFGLNSNLGSIL